MNNCTCEHCGQEFDNAQEGEVCHECGCWICDNCDELECDYEDNFTSSNSE